MEQFVGARLKTLRTEAGLSLSELALRSGLTKGFLSQVERGKRVPSIGRLLKVASALRQPVSSFFASAQEAEPVSIVRRNERRPFAPDGSRGDTNYEALTYKRPNNILEAFIMRLPSTAERRQFMDHAGEEFVFVLRGRVELRLKDRRYTLRPGDCSHFDSSIPHIHYSTGRRQAEALVVIANRARHQGRR